MLGCIERLYAGVTFEQFPLAVLNEVLKLVPAESGTFNYLAPAVPKVVTAATPALPDQDQRTERFAQYLPLHGVLNHYLRTGDPGAFKLSDFQSAREYHSLPLYAEFYREITYEDQFSFFLFPPGAELIGISLARDRRSFTERDRAVLNLFRPHVSRAFRHLERADTQKRMLLARDTQFNVRVTSVLLDARDQVVQFAPEAEAWISQFFPGRPRNCSLPGPITDWLRRCRKVGNSQASYPALLREKEGKRLRLTVFRAHRGGGRILVLGLETSPTQARSMLGRKLTSREIEVLLQVEQGKTNGEISASLGISPLTVRCHLEHIFEKLHVPSRTAAVTRFRQICFGHEENRECH